MIKNENYSRFCIMLKAKLGFPKRVIKTNIVHTKTSILNDTRIYLKKYVQQFMSITI